MFTGLNLPSTSTSYRVYNIDDSPEDSKNSIRASANENGERSEMLDSLFSHGSATPHNRRMVIPYSSKWNPVKFRESLGSSMHDQPLLLYRFFDFYCATCDQSWMSPLYRARDGCFCRICHHFVVPRGICHSLTPYLGKETCYGKYTCHVCARGWSSYKSLSNCPDQCFECGTLVYPYYQIAHSVLHQKIHKNADPTKSFKEMLSHSGQNDLQNKNNPRNSGRQSGPNQNQQHRQQHPRKIISISGIQTSTRQTLINKKRLHCLNNVPFLKHSPQQVRRQTHLKPCFSEPIISS